MVASVGRRSVGRRSVVGRSCFWRRSVVGRGGRKGAARSILRSRRVLTGKRVSQKKARKCAMRCVLGMRPLMRNRMHWRASGGGRARRSAGGRAGGRRSVGGLPGVGRRCCRRSWPKLSWSAGCCRGRGVAGRSLRGGVGAEKRRRFLFCGLSVGSWWAFCGVAGEGGCGLLVACWRAGIIFFGGGEKCRS